MGELRFSIYPADILDRPDLELAYVTGMDRMPWRTHVDLTSGSLCCKRPIPESGSINVPWQIEDFGQLMMRSTSLMERATQYQLQVELSRGKVSQLRDQVADLELLGWPVPKDIRRDVRDLQRYFSQTIVSQHDPQLASDLAAITMTRAVRISEELCIYCADKFLEARTRSEPGGLQTSLSCRVQPDQHSVLGVSQFSQAFTAVTVDFSWRSIEPSEGKYDWDAIDKVVDWCVSNKIPMRGGPIIDWSATAIPDWLWLWEKDFNNVLSFMSDFIETVIARYREHISTWNVTSRTNSSDLFSLTEEERLKLTVRAIRIATEAAPDAIHLITLGQPWGEYTARREFQYSPLHFADALVRADLGLKAIGLEFAMGFEQASYCRDTLETSSLLDYYSYLGLPLYVNLAAPSSATEDENSMSNWTIGGGNWHEEWNHENHGHWINQFFRLASSKPYIHDVAYCHASDQFTHDIPNAGLIGSDGSPKPALDRLCDLNAQFWSK